MEITDEWVQLAADAVMRDLSGRSGVGDELSQIDDDVMDELRDSIGRAALSAVAPLIAAEVRERAAKVAEERVASINAIPSHTQLLTAAYHNAAAAIREMEL